MAEKTKMGNSSLFISNLQRLPKMANVGGWTKRKLDKKQNTPDISGVFLYDPPTLVKRGVEAQVID